MEIEYGYSYQYMIQPVLDAFLSVTAITYSNLFTEVRFW